MSAHVLVESFITFKTSISTKEIISQAKGQLSRCTATSTKVAVELVLALKAQTIALQSNITTHKAIAQIKGQKPFLSTPAASVAEEVFFTFILRRLGSAAETGIFTHKVAPKIKRQHT